MKILSYNINRCTQAKIDKVLSMGADIMVLPECASYDNIILPQKYSMEWIGDNTVPWKGLGVIWDNHHELVVAPWYNNEHKYIFPLIVDRRFLLFATWPTKTPNGKQSYPQILFDASSISRAIQHLFVVILTAISDSLGVVNQPGRLSNV